MEINTIYLQLSLEDAFVYICVNVRLGFQDNIFYRYTYNSFVGSCHCVVMIIINLNFVSLEFVKSKFLLLDVTDWTQVSHPKRW